MSAAVSLLAGCTKTKVTSSVGKQYGKDKMFDGCADTCWQSKEGKPQSITLEFDRARCIQTLRIQFQGGFAPTECQISVGGGDKDGQSAATQANGGQEGGAEDSATRQDMGEASKKLVVLTTVYPHNTNDIQDFQLPHTRARTLKITFVDSADMFGRIVVYLLDILGSD